MIEFLRKHVRDPSRNFELLAFIIHVFSEDSFSFFILVNDMKQRHDHDKFIHGDEQQLLWHVTERSM